MNRCLARCNVLTIAARIEMQGNSSAIGRLVQLNIARGNARVTAICAASFG